MVDRGASPGRPAAHRASRGEDRARAPYRPGVCVAADRHPQRRSADRAVRADPDRAAAAARTRRDRRRGGGAASEAAAALRPQAERPVLIAGDAVAQSRAHAELVELAELLGAPVYAEGVANTASFPSSHPLFRGSMVRL